MSEKQSTRRKFLQFLGLSTGALLTKTKSLASIVDQKEILKLNPEQQEFMVKYGKWMDEFIPVIRTQKKNPLDPENNKKMIALTERAEAFKPQLSGFMKDQTFSTIYIASIERMKNEI